MATTEELMGLGMPSGQAVLVAKQLDTTLTDSSTGTASDTIAAMTNTAALTDNSGGTANDVLEDCNDAVTGVDGTGNTAASKTDVDARLVSIANNIADLADELATQRTLNIALINAVASLSVKINAMSNGG